MKQIAVRKIPENQYEMLKQIATENNRSAEAEVRFAIFKLVQEGLNVGFGFELHRQFGGMIDDDNEFSRSKTETDPVDFK
ncbi:MAG: hypothetical protein V3V13_01240 [Paracoccaceae bacterium]